MHLSEAKHVLQSFGFPVLLRLQLEAIPATNGCRYPVLYLSLWPHLCPFQSVYPQEGTQSLRLRGFLINPADVEPERVQEREGEEEDGSLYPPGTPPRVSEILLGKFEHCARWERHGVLSAVSGTRPHWGTLQDRCSFQDPSPSPPRPSCES